MQAKAQWMSQAEWFCARRPIPFDHGVKADIPAVHLLCFPRLYVGQIGREVVALLLLEGMVGQLVGQIAQI